MFALGGFQVGEDNALFGEFFIQVDGCAAGGEDNLSAVLVAGERLEQVFGDGGRSS
jgi:hypothetical protein